MLNIAITDPIPIIIAKAVKKVLTGFDLNGNEISIEADELESRLYQHEMDHLDGRLLLEYLDEDQQLEAKRILRTRIMDQQQNSGTGLTGFNSAS